MTPATELVNAAIEAMDAHTAMSSQVLNSKDVQVKILNVLLDYAGLYEVLKARKAS